MGAGSAGSTRAGPTATSSCARAPPRTATARTRATRTSRPPPPRPSSPCRSPCGTSASAIPSDAADASSRGSGACERCASSRGSRASPSPRPPPTASPRTTTPSCEPTACASWTARGTDSTRSRGAGSTPPRPTPAVDGRREPRQLRQAVQAQLRRGTRGGALHRGVRRGGDAADEQVQVGARVHNAQQRFVGLVRALRDGGGGARHAEQVAHRGAGRRGSPRRVPDSDDDDEGGSDESDESDEDEDEDGMPRLEPNRNRTDFRIGGGSRRAAFPGRCRRRRARTRTTRRG